MKYEPETHTLTFSSQQEVHEFHDELSHLIRSAMVSATRRIEDANEAKAASKEVMQEFHALIRTLNVLRAHLPRKGF